MGQYALRRRIRADETIHIGVPVTKPGNLSWILVTYLVEGKNQILQVVL